MTVDIAAEVIRYLDKLGTTTEEIRTSLKDLHVTGVLGANQECPVARYLKMCLPDHAFAVGNGFVVLGDIRKTGFWWLERAMTVSPAIADFIVNFDLGRCPELVVGGHPEP